MTKDSCDVGNCKNGNTVFYNQLIRLKSVKIMRKLSHKRLLKLIDVQQTTANINYYTILGDPGAVSGGGEKSKRARKKFGRRKVK